MPTLQKIYQSVLNLRRNNMANQVRFGADQQSQSMKRGRLQLKDLIRQGSNPDRSPKDKIKTNSQNPKSTKVTKKPIKKLGMTTMPTQKVY